MKAAEALNRLDLSEGRPFLPSKDVAEPLLFDQGSGITLWSTIYVWQITSDPINIAPF
jgi:hypothetical protein